MTRLLPIALVVAIAAAAVVWMLAGGGEPARPVGEPVATDGDPRADRPAIDPESSRTVAPGAERPAAPTPEPDAATSAPPPRPTVEADPLAPPKARVTIAVRRAGSGEPIAEFRVVRAAGLAHLPLESRGRDGRFVVEAVEPGAVASVIVEADGYTPSDPLDIAVAPFETAREVRVDLVPAARGSGVMFLVRDSDLQPLEHLRIIAWRRALDAGDDVGRTRAWTRRAFGPGGHFELPDLELGDYRFELGALTAEGDVRLQQPAFVEVEWRGGGRDERAVDLRAGAGLELTVLDPASGRALGKEVALLLEDAAGERLEIRFGHREEERTLVGIDTLPHAGPCKLDAPLPPGRYRLKCQFPGGDIVERDVFLTALQETKVQLP